MNCREAQSLFTSFIDKKLDIEKTEAFLEHVESCGDCYDELEVHFIVFSGLRQLDNDEEDISDFKAAFKKMLTEQKELVLKDKRQKRRKRIAVSVGLILFALIIAGGVLFYTLDNEAFSDYRDSIASYFGDSEGDVIYKHVEYTLEPYKWKETPFKAIVHNTEVPKADKKDNAKEKEKKK